MSIVRMRKVFQKRGKATIGKRQVHLPSPAEAIFYLIIIIFVAGAYYTFGGPAGNRGEREGGGGRVNSVVAVVNGEKIPRALYDLNLTMRQDMGERDVTQERWTKVGVLNSLIDNTLMKQAVKREGVKVENADVKKKIDDEVEQSLNTRFPEKRALSRFLKKQKQTLAEYKDQLRSDMGKNKDQLKEQVAQDKLKEIVEKKVALTDDELKDSYTEVKASHILIKPETEAAKAKPAAGQPKPDGDALAKAKADALLAQVKQGADFAKLAKENSQDPGSAVKGGDLGWFKRGTMVKEFDEVAFKLQPGQVSDVFKSPFGYHFIKVFEKRTNLPKDFEKNKNTYRDQVLSERKYKAWSEYQDNLKKQAQIEINDPELKAYDMMQQAEKTGKPTPEVLSGVAQLLDAALKQDPRNTTALWELASLAEQAGDKTKAAQLLDQAAATELGAMSPTLHMKLADLYLDLEKEGKPAPPPVAQPDQTSTPAPGTPTAPGTQPAQPATPGATASLKDRAVDQYRQAFDRASAFTQMNYFMNMQLEQKVKSLNQPELAKQIAQWLTEYRAEQAKNPQGGMGGMGGFGPMGGGMPFSIPGQ